MTSCYGSFIITVSEILPPVACYKIAMAVLRSQENNCSYVGLHGFAWSVAVKVQCFTARRVCMQVYAYMLWPGVFPVRLSHANVGYSVETAEVS